MKFPVRIKCATLAWNTLQQALDFKYVTKPMTKEEVVPLFDLLAAEKR